MFFFTLFSFQNTVLNNALNGHKFWSFRAENVDSSGGIHLKDFDGSILYCGTLRYLKVIMRTVSSDTNVFSEYFVRITSTTFNILELVVGSNGVAPLLIISSDGKTLKIKVTTTATTPTVIVWVEELP